MRLILVLAALLARPAHGGLSDGVLLTVDRAYLERSRALIAAGDSRVMAAYKELLRQADGLVANLTESGAFSVMNKTGVAPSGDKHDYISLSEYYWPCTCTSSGPLDPPHCPASSGDDAHKPPPPTPCDNATGLPYVRHDGWLDPRIADYDMDDLASMFSFSTTLAYAYFFSGNESYGAAGARVLKAWFVSSDTKMAPNMQYAQVVPGLYPDGQHSGTIDGSCHLPYVYDALTLISPSPAWSAGDNASVTSWVTSYTKWLANSAAGRNESALEHNNHATWYIVGVSSGSLWTGDVATAAHFLSRAPASVIGQQVALNGSLPYELARTRSFFYSDFDSHAMMLVGRMTDLAGLPPLWTYTSPGNGTSLRSVVDFFVPYAALVPRLPWPFPQVDPPGTAPYTSASLFDIYLRAAVIWSNSTYRAWAYALDGDHSTDLATLLWAQTL